MPLNLNANKLVIAIKPDYQPVSITGYTPTVIVGSGGTTVSMSGQTFVVYSPAFTLPTVLIGSGNTSTTNVSGNTWVVYSSGGTSTSVTMTGSGATTVSNPSPNNFVVYTPTGGTGGGTWGSITGTLSGQTDLWQELEAKALQTDFESHTGDTTIHYKMSGITIQQSQVSGLTTALAGKTNTGTTAQLRTDFNTFSGNTYVMYDNIKVPTGFIDNLNIGVSYDSVNRTITLTKATPIEYYWRGKLYSLGTSWTSVPHTNDTQGWFLYSSDGVTFHWSTQAWIFSNLMVAYKPTNSTIAIREVHGTQDSNTHEELHRVLGCYRVSGFGLTNGTYVIQPAVPTNANNTFGLEAGIVADEDLKTNINAWIQDSYTRLYFTSTGVKNYQTAQALPFRMGTTYPLINSYNGSTFTETEAVSGRYFNYYIIRVPVTSDSNSQLYRAIVLQAQFSYTSLLSAQTENPQSLYFGDFSDITPETVIVERITYRSQSAYNGATGRVRIEATAILSGSRFSQTATNTVGNAVTAGNVSVVPVSPFTAIDMQDWTGEAMDYFSQTGHTHDYTGSTILNKPSFVGSGNTDVTLSGNTYIIYSPTGGTSGTAWGDITGTLSNQTDLQTALDAKSTKIASVMAINTNTLIDATFSNQIVEVTAVATVVLPTDLTDGFQVTFINTTTEITTFAAGSGAAIVSKDGKLKLASQWGAVSVYLNGSTWRLIGDLSA